MQIDNFSWILWVGHVTTAVTPRWAPIIYKWICGPRYPPKKNMATFTHGLLSFFFTGVHGGPTGSQEPGGRWGRKASSDLMTHRIGSIDS